MQGRLYGMSKSDAAARGLQLCRELDLEGFANRRAQTLSGGQRRRLDIAMGLIHAPKLVFLDEPSTGLDPQSRANLWAHIRGLRDRQGATVFLTTHYLDEADALCDRILIIDHGSIVASGTPAELKRRVSGDVITFEIGRAADEGVTDVQTVRALLAAHPAVREAAVDGGEGSRRVRATVEQGDAQVLTLAKLVEEAGFAVTSLHVGKPTLDDVFLTLTGRSLREQN